MSALVGGLVIAAQMAARASSCVSAVPNRRTPDGSMHDQRNRLTPLSHRILTGTMLPVHPVIRQ